MKVTVNEKPTQEKAEYPCLKEYKQFEHNTIVLFTAETEGTVVYTNDERRYTGEYSESWAEGLFTPFNGSITLEND